MLLGMHMLLLSDLAEDEADARAKLEAALRSGAGLEKLQQMIAAQGGDASYLTLDRIDALCSVKKLLPVYPLQEGYLAEINAECIGTAAQMLGAGRATKADAIDPAVGLVMHKRLGDHIRADEPLCTMYVNDESRLESALANFHRAFTFSDEKPEHRPMVYDVIS